MVRGVTVIASDDCRALTAGRELYLRRACADLASVFLAE
jgi:hypothetical protein